MSNDDFEMMGWSDSVVVPPTAMRPGEVVTVANSKGEVLHRFTASLVPKDARVVGIGDFVEYTDASGKHVRGKVFHAAVDPVTGLDVVSLEEEHAGGGSTPQ